MGPFLFIFVNNNPNTFQIFFHFLTTNKIIKFVHDHTCKKEFVGNISKKKTQFLSLMKKNIITFSREEVKIRV